MISPYYNRLAIAPGGRATAEQINAEFEKIAAAFAQLPDPTAIPSGGGLPNYSWHAYADSADGTSNFTTGAPGNRAYVGLAANRTTPTPSTHPEDYVWTRLRGVAGSDAPLTILEFSTDNAAWHVGYASGDIYWRQSVDGGVTFTSGQQLTASDLNDLDPVAAAKLGGIQPGADVTIGNTQRVTAIPNIAVNASYLGVVNPGQLPIQFATRRFKGNTDVSKTTDWTITADAGLTMTIDNNPANDSRGLVSLTDLTVASGSFRVTSVRDGVTIDQTVSVTRFDAQPPVTSGGTGSGGGTNPPGSPAFDNSFITINSVTTHAAISDVLGVTVGTSGQVNCTAPLSFSAVQQGTTDTPTETFLALKFQYSADGSTGWSDVAAEATGTSAFRYKDTSSDDYFQAVNITGSTNCSQNKTGLTPGATAYFQLMGRMVAGGVGITGESGQAVATPQ